MTKTYKQFISHIKENWDDPNHKDYNGEYPTEKLHPALQDLHHRLKRSEHHDPYGTDYRGYKATWHKHPFLDTRHLGKWKGNGDDDDHEQLHKSSETGIHKIVKEVEKHHKVKIEPHAGEKNYISFHVKD